MTMIDPLTATAVLAATAATDAVYVMFTSAVVTRKRVPAATWSSIWYLLSSFAIISYTSNWAYVLFAALYALVLPLLEGQPSLGRTGGLFGLTLTLGILMGGPLSAAAGMLGGITLFGFGRRLYRESDRRTSETALM